MFICTQFIDQLPVGLLAQLVERCTGIAEVMGSDLISIDDHTLAQQLLSLEVFAVTYGTNTDTDMNMSADGKLLTKRLVSGIYK